MSAGEMIHQEGLKYLELFNLEKRRFRGDLSAIFSYLIEKTSLRLCSQRARSNKHKLQEKSD